MADVGSAGGRFALLSDDIVLNVLAKLDGDPRDWARVACVSSRFDSLVRDVCCRAKCSLAMPAVVSDLLSPSAAPEGPPGGWAALHKLSVCCPGLLHAGVLLEHSDFGLERELGPDHSFLRPSPSSSSSSNSSPLTITTTTTAAAAAAPQPSSESSWSLFDDLYFDTMYDSSESQVVADAALADAQEAAPAPIKPRRELPKKRKRQCSGPVGSHLASGAWNLSREQGNKLLASRFRGDCLYICDWPGCVHAEEKRNYMLFRGVFKNFKRSRVWRTISDAVNRSKIDLDCAFCGCKETWDLHSAFCLKSFFGYHDDGEPVVRAYVCENGHVSGAWTERPMYT